MFKSVKSGVGSSDARLDDEYATVIFNSFSTVLHQFDVNSPVADDQVHTFRRIFREWGCVCFFFRRYGFSVVQVKLQTWEGFALCTLHVILTTENTTEFLRVCEEWCRDYWCSTCPGMCDKFFLFALCTNCWCQKVCSWWSGSHNQDSCLWEERGWGCGLLWKR